MIRDELANWAKWVTQHEDDSPRTCVNWDLIDQAEYKNCYETSEEKLERIKKEEVARDIDVDAAARVERWIVRLAEPYRSAVRIEWAGVNQESGPRLMLSEDERMRWHQTVHEWQDRKARFLNHALRSAMPGCFHIRGAHDFEEALWRGEELLDRQLTMWQRAA